MNPAMRIGTAIVATARALTIKAFVVVAAGVLRASADEAALRATPVCEGSGNLPRRPPAEENGFTWAGVTVANPFSSPRHALLQALLGQEFE